MCNSIRICFMKLIILCSVINTAYSQDENLLFYEDFPPFCYIENDQPKGVFFDIVTTVFEGMGASYKFQFYPFKRALFMATQKEKAFVGIYKTDERLQKLDYSKPFYKEKTVFFVAKGQGFRYSTINDLKGKHIGVKLGWSYGREFDQARESKLFTTTVGSQKQIFRLLLAGKLDTVVDNELSGMSVINDLRLKQNIEVLPKPLLEGNIYIAIRKGANTGLIKKFNNHVKRIEKNGTFEKILANYH